jgi:hypothetical protein
MDVRLAAICICPLLSWVHMCHLCGFTLRISKVYFVLRGSLWTELYSPYSYVEALVSNVIKFGDRTFTEVVKVE